MLTRTLLLLVTLLYACWLPAQQKSIPARKALQPPVLDGKLNDAAWQQAALAEGFIVHQPQFGAAPAEPTRVYLLYDNEAVYVGAFLRDNPSLVRRQLTSRDNEQMQDVDHFHVAIDPYNDNQNAFKFLVTSANVQSDVRISPNGEDYNWDAIWDSRTALTDSGWVVEMKIPYMALRFPKAKLQTWGINFSRFIRRLNEESYWNTVDPKIDGYVNQFGDWLNLEDLQPPLRLSFLPYVSTGYRHVPLRSGTQQEWLKNGGMDVKWGVNESFTLDMTLIPDFGQVQSDNVILNLSPFEQQFQENRPFFTEGTELFNKAGIFYSRRVGATPSGYYDARAYAAQHQYRMLRNPTVTQLYNATKFSGRTRGNLGIGVFNAVTAPMHAEMEDGNGNRIVYETEPLANYNIIVFDQALKNRSFISFTNTNVWRNGDAPDANVSALDLSFFDKKNTWNLRMRGRFSHITGGESRDGFKSVFDLQKVSGKWQFGLTNNIESKNYDPNDLGFLSSPNEFTTTAFVSFQQFTPNRHFNYRRYNVSVFQTNLFEPFLFQELGIRTNFLHVFRNFWDVNLVLEGNPVWYNDYFELRREGKKLKRAKWAFAGVFGSSDSRKKLFVRWGLGMAESPIEKDPFYVLEGGARYRFSPKFSLDLDYSREHDKGNFGFVFFDPVTREPVIGRRELKEVTTILSGIYNFKPRMNLTLRARHYWSPVHYVGFFDVLPDGHWTARAFAPGQDRNANIFNLDMFFTWDFRLGSRLIVAWKNALAPDESIAGDRYSVYGRNLGRMLALPHSNELSVKFVYFVDYHSLTRGARL